MHEVRGTVQWIDDPLEVVSPVRTTFLREKRMVRMTPANRVDDSSFRDPVDFGDEIVRRLLLNGEGVEAVDVARNDVPGLPGGTNGDIQ